MKIKLLMKMHQLQNDAADQQPWRCVVCGEAVSQIRRNDCACIRALKEKNGSNSEPT